MKKVIITIHYDSVRDRAKELIANIAQKIELSGLAGAYDRIVNVDEEDDLLDKWMSQAAIDLKNITGRWLSSYTYTENAADIPQVEIEREDDITIPEPEEECKKKYYCYTLLMPENWINLSDELQSKMSEYMVYLIVKEWMKMVQATDQVQIYDNDLTVVQINILTVLQQRSRPFRHIKINKDVWIEED